MSNYTTISLTAAIWFMAKFLRYSFPPLFEPLQLNYGISTSEVGLLYSFLLIVYAFLQFPSGLLADRVGSVYVIIGGAILTAFGAILISIEGSIAILILSVAAIGVGTGVHKTVAVGILSTTYPNRTGRMLGIFDTIGSYGGVGASAIVTIFLLAPSPVDKFILILPGKGWRGLFFLSGLIGLFLAILFFKYVPVTDGKNETNESQKSSSIKSYFRQFSKPRFALFVLITILFGFTYNGTIAFIPLFLTDTAGLNTTEANSLYSIIFIVSFIQIFTGEISDRIGRLRVITGTLFISGMSLFLLVIVAGNSIMFIPGMVILFAMGSNGFRPVRGIYLIELLPESLSSGGLGIVRTLLMAAGAVAPMIIGYIADITNFQIAFLFLAGSLLIASLLSVGLLIKIPKIR